jgi:flagellar biosynthesis protein FlhF
MELHRILARDHRSALDEANTRFGKDVLIVSTQSVNGMTELVVALDNVAQASAPPIETAKTHGGENFADAFRKALDSLPAKPAAAPARVLSAHSAQAQHVRGLTEHLRQQGAHAESRTEVHTKAPQGPQGQDWESLQDALQQVRIAAAPAAQASFDAAPPVQVYESAVAKPAPANAVVGAAADTARAQELVDMVRSELAALRQEVSLTRQMQMWPQQATVQAGLEPLVQAMHEVGVPAALRTLLTDGLRHVQNVTQGYVQVREQLLASIEPNRTTPDLTQGIHAFCGPTGAGKSHMAVRVARAATVARPADQVAIIAFNDQRCGAWSQLQVLSAQAGVACYRARDLASLRLLLDELGGHGLVMIDTAGADGLQQMQAFRAMQHAVQCHVVLPADASQGTLRRWMQNPQVWDSMVVTKLDESDHPWAVIQHLCDHHTPVAAMSQSHDPQAPVPSLDPLNLIECGMQRLRAECEAINPAAAMINTSLRPHLSVVASA